MDKKIVFKGAYMKKSSLLLFRFLIILLLTSCSAIRRDYDDMELEDMATSQYGFTQMLFFKIVDSDTAKELTGTSYTNSGVIYGLKDGNYEMLFVPRKTAEDPFFITNYFIYDIEEITNMLNSLKDDSDHVLYNNPSGDYGGLSISVSPYQSIHTANPNIVFDSPLFYIFTTDDAVFYVGMEAGEYLFFDMNFEMK